MWYVQPVADEKAEGTLRELYDQDLRTGGHIKNTTRVWSYRSEMMAPWMQLMKTIRTHLRLRTFELVTLAAAQAMGCKY